DFSHPDTKLDVDHGLRAPGIGGLSLAPIGQLLGKGNPFAGGGEGFEYDARLTLTPSGEPTDATYKPYDGRNLARFRHAAVRSNEEVGTGMSNVLTLMPGKVMQLKGLYTKLHPKLSRPQKVLVTKVIHLATPKTTNTHNNNDN